MAVRTVYHVNDLENLETITYNLSREDMEDEFNRAIVAVRHSVTVGGRVCGNGRTTYLDPINPLIKLRIIAQRPDQQNPEMETALLIKKEDLYAIAFVTAEGWKLCLDSGFTLHGSSDAHFNTRYPDIFEEQMGPGSVHLALHSFRNNRKLWHKYFFLLVFIFIESVRFDRVLNHFMNVFAAAAAANNILEKRVVPIHIRECHRYWAKISTSMRRFYLPEDGEQSVWIDLTDDIVAILELEGDQRQACDELIFVE